MIMFCVDLLTGKSQLAYDVYANMELGRESIMVLDLIANESYKVPRCTPSSLSLLYDTAG